MESWFPCIFLGITIEISGEIGAIGGGFSFGPEGIFVKGALGFGGGISITNH